MKQEEILETIVNNVVEVKSPEILELILTGRMSPLHILSDTSLREFVIASINKEWDRIHDVTNNPFWSKDVMSRQEEDTALQRVLLKTENLFNRHIHILLNEHYLTSLSAFNWQLAFIKKIVDRLSNINEIPTAVSVSKLQDRVSELSEAITITEKTKIALLFFDHSKTSTFIEQEQDYIDSNETKIKSDARVIEELEWDWAKKINNNQEESLIVKPFDEVGINSTLPELPGQRSEKLIFKRTKLVGGIVYSNDGKQVDYLNEIITRSLDLQHNDELRIKCIRPDGKREYVVANKIGDFNSDRISVKYCIAEIDVEKGMVVINQHIVGGQRQDTDYQFQFNITDVLNLRIEDGSIIDIAYWSGKPDTAKIIWNHPSKIRK